MFGTDKNQLVLQETNRIATVQHNSENIMVWKCFPVLGQGNMQSLIQVWTTP